MKKNLTELVFVLDRSGSMTGLESDTIGGFNSVLEKHREAEGEAIVSTILFDQECLVLHDRIDIQKIAPLTDCDYETRGSTALLDAVGGAIDHTIRVQRYMPDEYKAEHVIFVITTDGMENSSHKYSYEQIKRKIGHETEKYGWEFIFMGANIDAVAEAARIGISADRAVTYLADEEGTAVMYDAVAAVTCCARSSASRPSGSWKEGVERDRRERGGKKHR